MNNESKETVIGVLDKNIHELSKQIVEVNKQIETLRREMDLAWDKRENLKKSIEQFAVWKQIMSQP